MAKSLDVLASAAAQEIKRLESEIRDISWEITLKEIEGISPIANATNGGRHVQRTPRELELVGEEPAEHVADEERAVEQVEVPAPVNSTRKDEVVPADNAVRAPAMPEPAAVAQPAAGNSEQLAVAVRELCLMLSQRERASLDRSYNIDPSFTTAMEQLALKSALPPLDVVKFCGNPCEYFKFVARYDTMVGSQNLSEAQKMARLLQFVDGRAKRAISGYDGVPGGLALALATLKRRFGQPHIVAEACVEVLTGGPNISSNDVQGLCDFADKARTLLETLKAIKAVGEMNMTNMSKMSHKLPVRLQVRWRDEAQRIRDKTDKLPSLEDLVKFVERAADSASDPVFGKIGDTSVSTSKPKPRSHGNAGIHGGARGSDIRKAVRELTSL
jgi:hypothetical protein